jgi:hypothetical protein
MPGTIPFSPHTRPHALLSIRAREAHKIVGAHRIVGGPYV